MDGGKKTSGLHSRMDPAAIKFSENTITFTVLRRPFPRLRANGAGGSSSSTRSFSESLKSAATLSLEKETLQNLENGVLTVDDIPVIRVVEHEGKYFTLDNARLWILKGYGHPIPVRIVNEVPGDFLQKLKRLQNGGDTIRVENARREGVPNRMDDRGLRLAETVLLWSVKDINNERMYIKKVKNIPCTFEDVLSYYKAFKYPLEEDTRAQLQRGLEEIGSADYMTLGFHIDDEAFRRGGPFRKLRISIVRLVQRGRKDDPWQPKPTDLVLLCTFLPKNVEDLEVRSEEFYTLALISNSEDDFVSSFYAKAHVDIGSPIYDMVDSKRSWYALYVTNMATAMRIWDALNPHPALFRDPRQYSVVKQNLYKDAELVMECTTSESEAYYQARNMERLKVLVEQYGIHRHLNRPQLDAITSVVMGLVKSDGVRTKLLQGPPGTGKTTVIVSLLAITTCLKNRILVSAPTNRAVSEIAERFLKTLEMEQSVLSEIANFASAPGNRVQLFGPLHIGDVLLVGNEDKLDTSGVLDGIFLTNRTKRLRRAMSPCSGWQHSAQIVLDCLSTNSSAFVMYEKYAELWDDVKRPCPCFLEYIRDIFSRHGQTWIESGLTMCADLPSKVLSAKARGMLGASCDLMEKLLKVLAINITDERSRQWFGGTCASPEKEVSFLDRLFFSAKEKLLEVMESKPGFDVLKNELGETWRVEVMCLVNASLLFCTTSTAGSWRVKGSGPFDYAIVDEAAQLIEAETTIITQLTGVNQMLLVGDPNQLQAMVTSKIAKTNGYDRSLFERLQTLKHPFQILSIQYRMHPEISRFPNEEFYHGVVENAPNVQSASYEVSCQDLYGSYAFLDIRSGTEKRGANNKSYENSTECDVVQHILNRMEAGADDNLNVGVISPYRSQVEMMRKRITIRNPHVGNNRLQVDFRTVDGFQGGERDVIIFSAVRANSTCKIGFLDDFRRLNVALTRGRYCVLIIGHGGTLSAADLHWRALITNAKKRRCYHDASNFLKKWSRIPFQTLSPERLSLRYAGFEVDVLSVIVEKLRNLVLKDAEDFQQEGNSVKSKREMSSPQVVRRENLQNSAL